MITSYEVGAIFKVVDEASANIRKITAEVRKLSAELKKVAEQFKLVVPGNTTVDKIAALAAEWGKVAKGMTDAAAAMTTAAEAAEKAAAATTRTERAGAVEAAEAEAAAVSAAGATTAAAAAGRRGARGGGRPGRGGRGGFMRNIFGGGHFGLGITGHGAHPRGHLPIRPGTAVGAALGYGMWKEGELEDAVFQALTHSNLPPTEANKDMLRGIIQQGAVTTGFGYKEVVASMLDELRLLKGTDQDIQQVLPELLKAAGTEARLKGTGLKESMDALVGIAHMFQVYDPEGLKQLAPKFGFLSTLSPETLKRIENAASYAVPSLKAAGLTADPMEILYEVVALQRAGALSTKSGTWVRAAFERALPPDPKLMAKGPYQRRMTAMRELGLVDAAGRSRVLDPTGEHLDIQAMLATVRAHAARLPLATRNAALKAVFGEQGERGIGIMSEPKVLEQLARLKREEPSYENKYRTWLSEYGKESPIQLARVTFEQMTNVLADLGRIYLPPVVEGLRELDKILAQIKLNLPAPVTKGIGWGGAIGAGIGGVAGLFGGPGGVIGGALLGLGIGSAVGAGVGSLFDTAPPMPGFPPIAPSSSQPGGTPTSPVLPLTPEMTPWDTKKMNYLNTIPPGSGSGSTTGSVGDVFLDGRKVTEIVMGHMAQMGSGPNEGPPFVDGTNSAPAMDSSYAFG